MVWNRLIQETNRSMKVAIFGRPPQPFQAELAPESSDIRTIKMIVSITLGFTLVLATGYLAAVILSDGAILLRPSQEALERHETYNDLIRPASGDLTGNGIVACIVDSGIAIDHPDLEGVNIVGWRDFINGNDNPYDDHGHGTSMAGLLVANGWLKGMAKDVDLLVAKALGDDGSGSDAIVAAAVDWCAENGAHVISLSLGGAPNILPVFNRIRPNFGGRSERSHRRWHLRGRCRWKRR